MSNVPPSSDRDVDQICLALMRENMRLAQENLAYEQAMWAQEAFLQMLWDPCSHGAFAGMPETCGPSPAHKPTTRSRATASKGGSTKATSKSMKGKTPGKTVACKDSNAPACESTSASSDDHSDIQEHANSCTVMMRNIPNNYMRDQLIDLLDQQGFKGMYDLVYLPVDFKGETGLGYAFVNLIMPDNARKFQEHFKGFSDWGMLSQKVCDISWSDVLQGLDAHINRYRNSPVMHESVPDSFKPALFSEGERIPFPPPTRKIRAPRLWSRR